MSSTNLSICTLPASSQYFIMYTRAHTYSALSTVRVSKVKYVVWSGDMSHVALMGRNGEWIVS